jgi:hypothetical protein
MSEEADKQYLAIILPKLKEQMPYKWRVQSFSKYKAEATCVAYIDARDVQDRLDEVCLYGWGRDHKEIKQHVYAGVHIVMPSGRTLYRWDCGTESNTEAEKGESSDSFKRSAVNWGVGRFLYDLKIQRVPANKKKVQGEYPHVVDNNGKQVWDLTKHIGNGSKVFTKTKEEPQKKQASVSNENDSSLEVFFMAIEALKTKDSAHQWKRDNQESIDSLGADKGKVMNKYLSKVKELK